MEVLSHNAKIILKSRYLLRDKNGKISENPVQLFHRIAKHIASAEKLFDEKANTKNWEKRFFNCMSNLLFLPNSPTLMNSGTSLNQLSACFVLPIQDSIESIFETLKNAALIQKSGGGTGFNFSAISPKNSYLIKTGGEASGPISFIKIYDIATENIKQGGKRRGANMGVLNISHPDIIEFIESKKKEGTLKNFNLSIGITNNFMKAVIANKIWELKTPSSNIVKNKIKAKVLWKLIINNAWLTGDPGLIFLDTINKTNPTPKVGLISCTNPCGEVPLLDYESCNLGSINLSKMITNNKIDWHLLEKTIYTSIRFLDNIIEINSYVIPEIEKLTKGNRKIGLGIMGWADLLLKLEIPYASNKAIKLAERLMKFIKLKSMKASILLAKERGVFTNWNESIYYPKTMIRNATRTSIAPTGTISIIANVSSSIEPLYALALTRKNVLRQEALVEVNNLVIDYLRKKKYYSVEIMNEIKKTGSILNTNLPKKIKNIFRIAHEIDFIWHIRHQIAFQKYTDNAVSKTINMPQNATEKDIEEAFLFAWQHSAKGITVFRDKSKSTQILNKGVQNQTQRTKTCEICSN